MNAEQFAKFKKWHDYVATVPQSNFYMPEIIKKSDEEEAEVILENLRTHACGSAACAVGYLPVVFPEWWCVDEDLCMPLMHESRSFPFLDTGKFFGVTRDEVAYIAEPRHYRQRFDFGSHSTITPAEVCAHMREVAAKYGFTIEEPTDAN